MASFFTLLLLLIFQFSRSTLPFSLSVDDIIVSSPKATFTAGFYPVGQNAYTFSIWFTQPRNNIQNATVVWMANRDHPVNGKRSTLSLLKTGNLILNDAGQFVVWSTNTSSTKPLQLILHDSGNLVLQDQKNPNSSILWQSFDFPTNTLLPEQSLHGYTKLVSSRTETNSSSGFYKLFFDYDNVLRLLYEGPRVSSIYWPDPWVREKRRGSEVSCSWVEQIVDPAMGSDYDIVKMESLATVALDCVAEEKDLRPNMSQVVDRLLSHEHDS